MNIFTQLLSVSHVRTLLDQRHISNRKQSFLLQLAICQSINLCEVLLSTLLANRYHHTTSGF